jgi:hypothetical protein
MAGGVATRARLALACALALTALGIVCSSAFAYRFNEPAITQTGPEETVFDWGDHTTGAPTGGPRPRCADDDIPDAAVRAFRDANGKLVLISSHFTTRRFVGDTFNDLTHPCAVVMPSGLNRNAASFDDHEWLTSPYTLDGTTVYALAHEEYQGWRTGYGYNCVGDWTQQQKCWRNSVVLAASTDGGATFTSPGAVVARAPYRFASGIGPYGYFKPSNIVKHTDGFYYALVRSVGTDSTPAQPDGVCVMRTSDLANPTSWRAWDGNGFNASFINPYTQAGNPADHVCPPVDPDLYTMTSTVVYSSYLDRYLLIDLLNGGGSYNPNPADKVPGIYFSTSKDLLSWTPPKLLMEAEIAETFSCGDSDPVRVPSLIDHASPARNFETIGQHAYLYFTRSNMYYPSNGTCYLGLDRDLVRIPIEFRKPASPTLTSTDPSSPANNNAPRVKGTAPAGTTVKLYANVACSGSPVGSVVAGTFATSGILASVPDDSTTSFYAAAVDVAGQESDCSPAPITYVEDSTPPDAPTVTASVPGSPANNNSPRIRGTAEAGTTVRLFTSQDCTGAPLSIAVAATFGTSGIAVAVSDNSTTVFHATATDQAGNTSGCSPSSVTYIEETTSPPHEEPPAAVPPPLTPASPVAVSFFENPSMPDRLAPRMSLATKVANIGRRGSLRLRLTCPASEPGGCKGTLRLETLGGTRLGSRSFHVGGGATAALGLRLSKRAQVRVKRSGELFAVAAISARDAAGNGRTDRLNLVLEAPRRKRNR